MIFKFHLSPQSPPPTSTSIAAAHCALHVRVGATNGGCLGQCHLRCAPATLTDISPKYPMIMAAKDSVRVTLQPDSEALTPPFPLAVPLALEHLAVSNSDSTNFKSKSQISGHSLSIMMRLPRPCHDELPQWEYTCTTGTPGAT